MAVTIAALRALGSRPVTLEAAGRSYSGSIVQEHLSDRSLMLQLALEGETGYPIVIAIDEIANVVER